MTTSDYLESLQNDLSTIVTTLNLENGTNFTSIAQMTSQGEITKGGGGSSYNGHYDATGLAQLNWTAEDIAYYQDNAVYWNSDKDNEYKVRADELSGNAGNYARFLNKNNISNVYFWNYDNLLAIPITNSQNQTSFSGSFQQCRSLISVPILKTQSATDMSNMFNGCWNLKSIALFDTSNVTTMSYMFNGCYALKTIPLLDTGKVENMSYMFNSCYALETIPLIDTSSVTNMQRMFYYCYNLREIPLLDTGNVGNLSGLFYNCNALVSVPVLDTKNATNIGDMFYGCNNLSDESLNNILQMCINAVKISYFKELSTLGISASRYGTRIQNCSNYQAFLNAGWTIGS